MDMKRFAQVCEAIAGTTKKLGKEALLAEYLRSLGDEDLRIAAVFLCGQPFPSTQETTLNLGWASVQRVFADQLAVSLDEMTAAYLQTGDTGSMAQILLEKRGGTGGISLKEVADFFSFLANSRRVQERQNALYRTLCEASPLEAKYILKIITGDMRIGLKESLVESSLAKAFGGDLREVQWANMLTGDMGETALLARARALDRARMTLFHPIKYMLAAPEESAQRIVEAMGGVCLVEDKYDGIRSQIHKAGEKIRIFSRTMDDITASFPDVTQTLLTLERDFILDGEIIVFKSDQIQPFSLLQKRLGRKKPTEAVLKEAPGRFVGFDILYHNGEVLLERGLSQRRAILEMLQRSAAFSLGEITEAEAAQDIDRAFDEARGRNNEGLVVKAPESPYMPGKRGRAWLKMKKPLATLDVVVTAAEYGHGKRKGRLSDYTFSVRKGKDLVTIGKAYSGLTDQEIESLTTRFGELTLQRRGPVHIVRPEVVLEVAFDTINRSQRHTSGFALRFPRIKRIRSDKTVHDIDSVERVQALFDQSNPQ
jgi:DNA ligase-1